MYLPIYLLNTRELHPYVGAGKSPFWRENLISPQKLGFVCCLVIFTHSIPWGHHVGENIFGALFPKHQITPNLRKIVRTTFLRYLRSIRHRNNCFFSLAANNPDPYEQIADPYLSSKKSIDPLGKWLKNQGFGQMKLLGWKNISCFGWMNDE